MNSAKEKKISLVRYSVYSIGLYVTILLGQFYLIMKNILQMEPVYIGQVYLSSLITGIMLFLLIAAGILTMKQFRNREVSDELADLNNFKAGYIAKYITVFALAGIILLVKDFNLVLKEDIVGNILSVFIICISFTEIIHHIVFIILEKR